MNPHNNKHNMEKKEDKKLFSIKGIALTSLGWEIAIPIFGGVLLGYNLDRVLTTTYEFTISFLFLGIFIGYYNIYKHIEFEVLRTDLIKQQNQKEDRIQR
jgi:predicted F0F1-ATPase subunit